MYNWISLNGKPFTYRADMTRKIFKDKRIWIVVFFILCFTGMFLVSILSPYASDDYYFQYVSSSGLSLSETISFVLHYGNGRVLGNLLTIALVQNKILGAFIKSLFCTAIILFSYLIIRCYNNASVLIISLFTVLFPPRIISQVFSWTSGFCNYIPPLLCFLIMAYCLLCLKPRNHSVIWILLFVVGLCGQLFVEHSAVINLSLVIVLSIILLKKRRNIVIEAIMCIIGMIIGTIILFMVPRLFVIQTQFEGYQKLNLGSLHIFVVSVVSNGMQICKDLSYAFLFWVALGAVLFGWALKRRLILRQKIALAAALASFPLTRIVLTAVSSVSGIKFGITESILLTVSFVLFIVAAFVLLLAFSKQDRSNTNQLLLLLAAVFSLLPLLIVYPIGQRCLAHSVMFFSILAVEMGSSLVDSNRGVQISSLLVAVCLFALIVCDYIKTNNAVIDRDRYINEQIELGNREITVFEIKSTYAGYGINSMVGYAFYYIEPGDIVFNITP